MQGQALFARAMLQAREGLCAREPQHDCEQQGLWATASVTSQTYALRSAIAGSHHIYVPLDSLVGVIPWVCKSSMSPLSCQSAMSPLSCQSAMCLLACESAMYPPGLQVSQAAPPRHRSHTYPAQTAKAGPFEHDHLHGKAAFAVGRL